jgi:hypothetical protein
MGNGMKWTRGLAAALALCGLVACDDGDGDGGGAGGMMADDGIVITQCSDTVDNDGDGLVDLDDPGCDNAADDDETDAVVPQCSDGVDNDDDGLTDLQDPACESTEDDDESDDPPPPQCSNGEDDDGDGDIDLADDGCGSAADNDESDDPIPPQCADGEDNDADGFVDYPDDPGCGSEFDDDEGGDGPPLPQCADGIDNNGDGRVDLADPGCTSPADPRESAPMERPICSNGLDDDDDGIIDFPREPGCASAGDESEEDPERLPACANGLDDDNDGRTDYPEEPGCAGVGDTDETDPMVTPACSDTRDNDRDGAIDYPEDRGCESAADGTELGSCGTRYDVVDLENGSVVRGTTSGGPFLAAGSCGGAGASEVVYALQITRAVEAIEFTTIHEDTELETTLYLRRNCLDDTTELACNREALNDGAVGNTLRYEAPPPGDYYLFVDGAAGISGAFTLTTTVVPLAECRNLIDDDEDGRTDYPADPGCERREDRTEADPDPLPACADDDDNDGDGLVDYPLDVGCFAASDDDEVDVCGQGVRVFDFPVDEGELIDTTDGGTNAFSGSCGGQNAVEKILRYHLEFNANLTFDIGHEETAMNHLLYVRAPGCDNLREERGCATLQGDPRNPAAPAGRVVIDRAAPGDYFVVVDNTFGLGGQFKLTVEAERLPPGCSDQFDNDGDGFVDAEDPGCADPDDEDEAHDPEDVPVCFNGLDDDEDGLVDFPFDAGCWGKGDGDELDPAEAPACNNGVDDDEDELIDFPADNGCNSAGDDSEGLPRPGPQCSNRIDDDDDGLTDYPLDPGCAAPGDLSEEDDDRAPGCFNELDDDRDGLVDFPFDPGCAAAGDLTEEDPAVPAACSNGIDDDEDGITDFPRDPGCNAAGEDDETDPAFPPQCANGIDDDRNNRIDWPDDPGCRFAADTRELLEGPVPNRCSDGIDNDDDGAIDLRDVGCTGARDNDEADPPVLPWCADEIDNDEDGNTDWPDDDGCAARGDECEQTGYGLCDGNCLDIRVDPNNCGQCGRVCDEGVECIDGFCGGLFVFEGIRENTPEDLLGGWEVCHNDRYNQSVARVADILAACDGEFVMYGCRPVGNANWTLLAMGERDEVFEDTARGNVLNPHNGVEWYFNDSYSIGFVEPGTGVSRNSCDTARERPERRMCWHTGGGRMNSGYRCGATFLNGNGNWERTIWTSR